MAKDPAVLFYTSDFLSGTFTMTDEQVGRYMRLLCIQHQKGMLTAQDMQSICKAYDEQVYSKFVKDGEFFYNERMKNESERRKKFSESRRKNAESPKNQTINKQKNEKAYAKHMETETEIETVTKTVFVFPFESQKFKDSWGILAKEPKWKKKTNSAIQASLNKLGKHPEDVAIKMIEDCIAGGWQGLVEPKKNFNETNFGINGSGDQKLGTSAARMQKLRDW